jgi:hypothetical protein
MNFMLILFQRDDVENTICICCYALPFTSICHPTVNFCTVKGRCNKIFSSDRFAIEVSTLLTFARITGDKKLRKAIRQIFIRS